jgi:hypothetical protein
LRKCWVSKKVFFKSKDVQATACRMVSNTGCS